jgi:hypothetical protein
VRSLLMSLAKLVTTNPPTFLRFPLVYAA